MKGPSTSEAPPADLPPSLAVRLALAGVSLVLAAAVWLPLVQLVFRAPVPPPKQEAAVVRWSDRLAARHLHLWSDAQARQAELARMRSGNAEWDFMGRSFLVWAPGTTLDFAAFPIEARGELRYAASNQVGDAVLLYAAVMGPVWDQVQPPRESSP